MFGYPNRGTVPVGLLWAPFYFHCGMLSIITQPLIESNRNYDTEKSVGGDTTCE
jgi:hypothetical protein